MKRIAVEVEINVSAPIEHCFDVIVPVDLSRIFTGHLGLPAVIGQKDATGKWDAVGQTRIVLLSDKSEAQEVLLGYDRPYGFNYQVFDFTGSLRFLAQRAEGQWWFNDLGNGRTNIRWEYAFIPASNIAVPFITLVAKMLWRGYMRKALKACKALVER